jgi:hypothetical protein
MHDERVNILVVCVPRTAPGRSRERKTREKGESERGGKDEDGQADAAKSGQSVGRGSRWENCAGRNRTYDLQVMSLAS